MESLSQVVKMFTEWSSDLDEEDLNRFSRILKRIELKKGEHLITIGEIATEFYWVETGLLRQYYLKNGRDITEHFAAEGNGMVCINSVFRHIPSELCIEALEKSIIYLVPYKELVELSERSVKISRYLRKLMETMLIISQEKADSWRFETAKERYSRFMNDFPAVANRASINHIASYLLMTPESLSRVRSGTL